MVRRFVSTMAGGSVVCWEALYSVTGALLAAWLPACWAGMDRHSAQGELPEVDVLLEAQPAHRLDEALGAYDGLSELVHPEQVQFLWL